MTQQTYAAIDYPLFDKATKDDLPLHVMTPDQAVTWRDTLSAYQKAFIETSAASMTAGSSGILLNEDGSQQGAYFISGAPVIWQAAKAAKTLPAKRYRIEAQNLPSEDIEAILLGFRLAQYQPHLHSDSTPEMTTATCHTTSSHERTNALARGTMLCRDLINAPANLMTPATLAEEATALAKRFNAKISITTGDDLAEHYPAIHTVGRAAEVAPRLIDMQWGNKGPIITLVGKGVTFDSGGLDLKPSKAMEMMKKDMGGSAHVLGLALAIMMTNLPIRLRVLIGAAENAVSDKSMRPMDVMNTRAGIKVEVGNTDAEGRLVLADALDLALEDNPDFMVDFATLTGAARVALGTECPALFCNHDHTAKAIMDAGKTENDPLWHMPLFEPYDAQLDNGGHMALSSTGSSGYGGAITAALFLRRFTGKDVNWAHIDVMAWNLASKPGRPKGGEAMGLRAIYNYIEQMC